MAQKADVHNASGSCVVSKPLSGFMSDRQLAVERRKKHLGAFESI
jgi:hypothetical protein